MSQKWSSAAVVIGIKNDNIFLDAFSIESASDGSFDLCSYCLQHGLPKYDSRWEADVIYLEWRGSTIKINLVVMVKRDKWSKIMLFRIKVR